MNVTRQHRRIGPSLALIALAATLGLAQRLHAAAPAHSLAVSAAPADPAPADPFPSPTALTTLPADFPAITVTVPATNTAEGYLFLDAFRWPPGGAKPSYLLILDNSGQPVYYKRLYWGLGATGYDFKVQLGDRLTYLDRVSGRHQVMDDSYTIVDSWRPITATPDHHDMQLLPNGNALVMATDSRSMDMSQIVPGGHPSATVIGFLIQELNPARQPVWEWRSFDHFLITDSVHVSLTSQTVDYAHLNTLEPDLDGNLLILSRNMDEVTKINRQTGDILWRLGGKNNQFTFVNSPRSFSWPHDVRRLPNGHLTLFDNGVHNEPKYSRGLEYEIDEASKVITLVQEYRNTPDVFGEFMANVQRLPNGNTLIGWGTANPTLTEFSSDGQNVFELTLPPGVTSYRAFRFPWRGRPQEPPLLVADLSGQDVALAFSWNGATDVATYRVAHGRTPASLQVIDTVTRQGFDTRYEVNNLPVGVNYFQVTAVDSQGNESLPSNLVSVIARGPWVFVSIVRR